MHRPEQVLRRGGRLWHAVVGLCALIAAAPLAAATFNGSLQLVVLEPSTAAELEPLRFGKIAVAGAAGTVSIDATTGARAATGGLDLLGSDFGPGHFAAQGTPNRKMNIKVPNGTITITHTNGIDTMTISNVHRTGKNGSISLDSTGYYEFWVGGDLAVGAGQIAGVYSGTYDIDINFQ